MQSRTRNMGIGRFILKILSFNKNRSKETDKINYEYLLKITSFMCDFRTDF
jgi:hypothetical protein